MAPMTLRGVERGGAGGTIGAYLAVMQVLGVEKDLDLIAGADPVGRELQDARLGRGTAAGRTVTSAAIPKIPRVRTRAKVGGAPIRSRPHSARGLAGLLRTVRKGR